MLCKEYVVLIRMKLSHCDNFVDGDDDKSIPLVLVCIIF